MKILRFRFLGTVPALLITIAGIVFYSCTYDNLELSPCNSLPQSITFQNDVLPLIRTNCSIPGCHSGGSPAGHLNLEDSVAYDNLLQSGSGYVKINSAKSSILYLQMTSTSNPMPPTGQLDECSVELVLRWIEQGAAR
jgi:hypothetical protein